jgi:acyl-CoA thioester hydrolase
MQTTISLQEGPRGKGGPFAEEPRAQTGLRGGKLAGSMHEVARHRPAIASCGPRNVRDVSLWHHRTTPPSTVQIEPFRLDSDRYPLKVRILARYADVDPLWHINNVAIAQYYEEARVSTTMMVMGGRRVASPDGERILIAHQSIDYLREATYPGALEVGIGVLRIGRSSFRYGMAMFQDGACVSVSEAVLVYADAQGPAALPDEYRQRLEGWLIAAP